MSSLLCICCENVCSQFLKRNASPGHSNLGKYRHHSNLGKYRALTVRNATAQRGSFSCYYSNILPPPSSLTLPQSSISSFLLNDTAAVGNSSAGASTTTENKHGAHSFPNPKSSHTPVVFIHHLQLQSHRHARASDIRR